MPMNSPPHPGEIVREECLKPLGLSVTRAAEILGVTRQTLSDLVNDKAGVSVEMSVRLSKAFGSTPETWLGLQMAYDLWNARERIKSIEVEEFMPKLHADTLPGSPEEENDVSPHRLEVPLVLNSVIEPVANPKSKRGDVWLLGRHRLMCGDSTNDEDVARLLNGSEPYLTVTDPPYGVDVDGTYHQGNSLNWAKALTLSPSPVAYLWCNTVQLSKLDFYLQDTHYGLRGLVTWDHPPGAVSDGGFRRPDEYFWYAVCKGRSASLCDGDSQSSIWAVTWDPDTLGGHATQKPVEAMERAIRNHQGDVFDPFVGSGTTIIAAERERRSCYAMEINPEYVDASVNRWETYTGKVAKRG